MAEEHKNAGIRKRIGAAVSIGIIAAVTVLLFLLSGQNADQSSALSSRVTAFIIRFLRLEELGLPLEGVEHCVRKLAHFTIYSVLGAGLCGAAQSLLRRFRFLAASAVGILIAAADEFHQLFVPGRGGSPLDVMLDYSGVAAGYAVCFGVIHVVMKICEKRKNPSGRSY